MMNIKETKIQERLKSDYDYVTSLGYTVLGVFLQGSQNYNLDYDGSDIDTKAILIPSFKDVVLNAKPVSTTLILSSDEHIDIKDIRLMMDCFKKQNINFIEVLFTKYRYMNPEYEDCFQPVFDHNELIAHYNNYKAVNAIVGMMYEKKKALCHPYPKLKVKIEEHGYDNKQLHHILRCYEFLNRYIAGTPYAECLIPISADFLVEVKSKYVFTLDEAKALAAHYVDSAAKIKEKYMSRVPPTTNKKVEELLNSVIYNVLKEKFKKEIDQC